MCASTSHTHASLTVSNRSWCMINHPLIPGMSPLHHPASGHNHEAGRGWHYSEQIALLRAPLPHPSIVLPSDHLNVDHARLTHALSPFPCACTVDEERIQ